ncbi:MAG: hypothetical protein ACRYG8_17355 [Janthinobacterium lividum]
MLSLAPGAAAEPARQPVCPWRIRWVGYVCLYHLLILGKGRFDTGWNDLVAHDEGLLLLLHGAINAETRALLTPGT